MDMIMHNKWLLVALLPLLWFLGLDRSPRGFYVDEAAGAAHVLCLAQDGCNYHGEFLPLYSQSLGGGLTTPVYLYTNWLWSRAMGTSPEAFRAFSVCMGVITLLAAAGTVYTHWGKSGFLFTLVAGIISPWGFQMSRIAWDPPLAPACLMLGLFLFSYFKNVWSAVLAGLFLSLSMYSYPTFYAFVPPLVIILLDLAKDKVRWLWSFLSFGFFCLPLAYLIVRGNLSGRFQMIGITSTYHANPAAGADFGGLLWHFIQNYVVHFTPDFLLFHGDANLRHSTGEFGIMSWLDAMLLVATLVILLIHKLKQRSRLFHYSSIQGKFLSFIVVALLLSFGPAALTWESLPHALRSIGGWPFLIMLTGILSTELVRVMPWFKYCILLVAVVFSIFYFSYYFNAYAVKSEIWYDTHVRNAMSEPKSGSSYLEDLVNDHGYDAHAATYFRMHYLKEKRERHLKPQNYAN